MGSPLLRHRTVLAAGSGVAAVVLVWIVASRGPEPAVLAAPDPTRTEPAAGAAAPAPVAELPEPVTPATEATIRDLECVRCELSAPEDPRMANLAPVDALLTDSFTGKPVPHAVLRAWDQNNVSLVLRSDARGRIVTDELLRGGTLRVEYADPPYAWASSVSTIRCERTVEHAAEWSEPDRWSLPTPALVPVALAGPVEGQSRHDLHWSDLRRHDLDNRPAAQLLPRRLCREVLRNGLHPATTHLACIRPQTVLETQDTLLAPNAFAEFYESVVDRDPLQSEAKLFLCALENEPYTVGSVTFRRPIRLGGKPFLLDVRTVSKDDHDELESVLGPTWRATLYRSGRTARDR